MTDRIFFLLATVVIAALICFTILSIFGASGTDTMRDVLLGLTAGLTGGWALKQRKNGNGPGNGDNGKKESPPKRRTGR